MKKFRLRPEEEIQLGRLVSQLKSNEKVQQMKNFVQHGTISTYDHARSVTRVAFFLNRRLGLGADEKSLARGAFLHDFYLYDWHTDGKAHGLHGYTHSRTALKNAIAEFGINEREKNVIKSHMWPLNITMLPRCREAWIVCMADKYVSTKETLFCRRAN